MNGAPFNAKRLFSPIVFALLSALIGGSVRAEELLIRVPENATEVDVKGALDRGKSLREGGFAGTVVVQLPRIVRVSSAIVVEGEGSGSWEHPLILRGAAGGSTVVGSIDVVGKSVAQSPHVSSAYFDPSVRSVLYVASLRSITQMVSPAFTRLDSQSPLQGGELFLFKDGVRLTPARWPIEGYIDADKVQMFSDGTTGLYLNDENLARLLPSERNAWVAGNWGVSWWYEKIPILDVRDNNAYVPRPSAGLGKFRRLYISNIALGLTGSSFYFDSVDGGVVYFIDRAGAASSVAQIPISKNLLDIRNASNIVVENIKFEMSRKTAIIVSNSSDILIKDVMVQHTGDGGISVNGGGGNVLRHIVVQDTGGVGVSIYGGVIRTLEKSGHVLVDSVVLRAGRETKTYRPLVRIGGVGVKIENNDLGNGYHSAVIFDGNDHSIVGNVIHDVVLDSDDAGAIYGGRNWASRGSIISRNYIYNVRNRIDKKDVVGVYLDDQLSGVTVSENVFQNVDLPVLVGGGRDVRVENNVSFNSRAESIRLDARGLTWQRAYVLPGGLLWRTLDKVDYKGGLFELRYPELARLIHDNPGAPRHNRVVGNVSNVYPLFAASGSVELEMNDVGGNVTVEGSMGEIFDGRELPASIRSTVAAFRQASLRSSELRYFLDSWNAK